MPQNTKIAFSIVSHNNANLVDKLINEIQKTCYLSFQIVLTINIPENTDFLEKYKNLQIITIFNQSIRGFGENHNCAFNKSNADFFFVLNPDISFKKFNFVSFLQNFENKSVSICGPKIIHPSGRVEDSPRKFPTIYKLIKRRVLKKDQIDYLLGDMPFPVDWVGGMFMAFNSDCYKKLNGFNENFFMYLEDAEICRESKRIKGLVIFDPNHSVIHYGERKNRREIKYFLIHLKSLLLFLLFKKRKYTHN